MELGNKFTLRPYQESAVRAGVDFFNSNADYGGLLVLPCGCHKKGTKVIMSNGRTKNVEDIQAGDFLLGEDGTKRTVLQTIKGSEMMYKIIPKKGESFIVNGNHILSLQSSPDHKDRAGSNTGEEIDNIKVCDYILKGNWYKYLYKLRYSQGVEFIKDKDVDVLLEPWALGVLIGDGSLLHTVSLSTPDQEIVDEMCRIMKNHGLDNHIREKMVNIICYHINFTDDKSDNHHPNRMVKILNDLGLWGKKSEDKFIPEIYKTGSIQTRSEILAGLLDTDGHLDKNKCFDFISKSERLSRDVVFVAKSLGLRATLRKKYCYCQTGAGDYYWRVCISGDLKIIPNKLRRKKVISERKQIKRTFLTGFSVEEVGVGDYYGFELDGNHLYMTDDFLIHHNSGKSLVIANIARQLKGKTIVLQPSKELVEQNHSKMVSYIGTDDVGIFSTSCGRHEIKKITYATIGTIIKKRNLFLDYQNLIIDEADLCNAKGGQYEEFIRLFGGKCLGLTATPLRLHCFENMFGGGKCVVAKFITRTRPRIFKKILHITQIKELSNDGYLCPLNYEVNENYDWRKLKLNSTGRDFDSESLEKYHDDNNVVGKTVEKIMNNDFKNYLIFMPSVREANMISAMLNEKKVICASVSAKTPKAERDAIVRDFREGRIRALANCNCFGVGLDVPNLFCLVIASPTQSVRKFYQWLGRGMRPHPGKQSCKVIDICGMTRRFGKIEDFSIITLPNGLHRLKSNAGWLTGFDFVNNIDLEQKNYKGMKEVEFSSDIVPFGKYKGTHVSKVPNFYIDWCLKTFDDGKMKDMLKKEKERRKPPELML